MESVDFGDATTAASPVAGLYVRRQLCHAGKSCVTQLFLRGQLRDATVLSLEQLRDAAVEMRGAAVEMRGASVFRMPNFEQLCGAAVELHGAAIEVDLGKARSGGSSTDASAFWDLLAPPMRARVVAAGFGDYAAGLRCTQPRFPPAICYALMERWNDYTHTFVFGFGEMTLTPVDYATITGLRFAGPVAPLDSRYQTATLGAQLVRSLLGVTTQTRYTAQGCVSYEGEAWRAYPGREVVELYTRSRLLLQGYWLDRYFLGERVCDIEAALAQRRVPHAPPRHMCMLEGMTAEDREEEYEGSAERKKHKTAAHYRAEAAAEAEAAATPTRPAGVVLGNVLFPPGMEVVLDPGLGLGSAIIIPADLRQAPPPPQLDPEHAAHDVEIGRLRRHQSRQSGAMARLQMEVDRLRTRLEVEGIPLDLEEDDDGSSFADAPPSPPPQEAASLSRRRR
ncbi:hypothetical protein JCGZ_26501 [Jatropha curcas]|uniref:Aminotransferase-like plant mobile domain-containing protein n=1 Tax=Jatropha curcas TaxID=180498 RepID=A0A067JLC8_JATCU|nr:hypothetical protein JCGZ_26501 [Jatropha curcas]